MSAPEPPRHRLSYPAVTLAITADATGRDGLASAFVGTVGWSDPVVFQAGL